MALTYTESGNNTASGSWAVSHPAASSGDLLIFNIGWDDSTNTTTLTSPSGPNGETAVVIEDVTASSSTSVRGKVVYYVATGSWSASTITFTPGASEQWSAVVVKVPSGEFDSSTPLGADNVLASSSTGNPSLPSLTAGSTDANGTVIGFTVGDTDNADGTVTGWTSRADTDRGAVGVNLWTRDALAANSESIASASGWTYPAGRDWVSFIYIVRPNQSPTVALNSPADASSTSDTTPTLDFTGTDGEGNDVRYEVQIDTVNTFDTGTSTIDSYTGTVDFDFSLYAGQYIERGQSFTGTGVSLTSVGFELKKTGSPTGNITAAIYAHTGTFGTNGKPVGSAIATSTNSIDISTLSTSYATKTFTFDGSLYPAAGTNYVAVVRYNGGDVSNRLETGYDSSSPSHGGNLSGSTDGTSWLTSSSYDMVFSVNGSIPLLDKVSGGSSTTETITSSQSWTAPLGVNSVTVETWGGGGGGGGANNSSSGGAGGGGGGYSKDTITVVPFTAYTISIGAAGTAGTSGASPTSGGNGGDTYFGNTSTVMAKGGTGGGATAAGSAGNGGASGSGVGSTKTSGGNGGTGHATSGGGGGGGSGGDTTGGGTGGNGGVASGGTAGAAGTTNGAAGGAGGGGLGGSAGTAPGGGGGGSGSGGVSGGAGAIGRVKLTYTPGDSGFANPDVGGDTDPFTSGHNIQYTVQAGDALTAGTYYWRVRGIDPTGSNIYGEWSSTRSFTITSGGGGTPATGVFMTPNSFWGS